MTCINLVDFFLSNIIFWGSILIISLVFFQVRDWLQYSQVSRRLQCRIWGHDYHDGRAQNLTVYVGSEGANYIYDYCQRCCTEQNKRPVAKET